MAVAGKMDDSEVAAGTARIRHQNNERPPLSPEPHGSRALLPLSPAAVHRGNPTMRVSGTRQQGSTSDG